MFAVLGEHLVGHSSFPAIMVSMFRARYRRILVFFAGVILSMAWWDVFLPRIGLRALSRRTRRERLRRIAISFRGLAISMGGVMIKVGQFLSARLDVLPTEITDELAGLQDEVGPESLADIRAVAEAELSAPLEEEFADFSPQPIASASIGQVHSAILRGAPAGDAPVRVVVKIQRPHIQEIVEVDLAALRVVGGWIRRYPPVRRRANVPAMLREFSDSLHEEIDYLAEGKNAGAFAENFRNRPDVRVPRVIWSHTTRRVLTLEDVGAIKITDYGAIEAAGIDRAEVAARLFDTYLKQIFEDRFFHADPHPGNLFVTPVHVGGDDPADTQVSPYNTQVGSHREDPLNAGGTGTHTGPGKKEWRLVFVDFGMVGRIGPNLFTGLREILIAVGTRDPARLVHGYEILGVLLPGADRDLLERATARVFERFWGKATADMMNMHPREAVEFVNEFGGLLREMPFQAPENIVLLVRCLGILSGMCTGLDPNFNVWTSVAPYATKVVEAEAGGRLSFLIKELGEALRPLLTLPRKTETLLERIEQGKLEVRTPDLRVNLVHLEHSLGRLAGAIIFAALLLSAVQVYLAGNMLLAGGLGAGGLISLAWVILRRN
ncbi:MAG TPA: AarF/UbiB family protein [Anaerolineaceae bacterium]|nr:AarF/UbiB family protein [Anaerolineaceae bacterium]